MTLMTGFVVQGHIKHTFSLSVNGKNLRFNKKYRPSALIYAYACSPSIS